MKFTYNDQERNINMKRYQTATRVRPPGAALDRLDGMTSRYLTATSNRPAVPTVLHIGSTYRSYRHTVCIQQTDFECGLVDHVLI